MTLAPNQPQKAQTTDSLTISEVEEQFNWKDCWYPVTFIRDLPKNRPYSFSLYDEPLVLFRNQDGKLICLKDSCSHRAAKLSDGQIIDGKIECLYHGWQFGTDGKCLHIPQLPTDAKIPVNSCVQSYTIVELQGIVWMWAGTPETADEKDIPTLADFDNPTVVSSDVVMDLPYNQNFFIENIIDPFHLYISHDGSLNSRKNAQPLEMEVLKVSLKGIEGRYRKTKSPNPWISLNFIAPNLVAYRGSSTNRIGGAALYSLPLGKERCRIIIRNYNNSPTWKFKLQPRWFEHFYRCKFLEEDLSLVINQQVQVNGSEESLKELYLPLKTSDVLVVEYRKWLDKYGSLLPFYQGYETSHNIDKKSSVDIGTRLTRHTELCSSCSQAYEVTKQVKQTLVGAAIALAALGIVLDRSWVQILVVSASLSAVILAVVAEKLKTKFESGFTRN